MTVDAGRFWSKVEKDGPLPELRPDLGPCWLWTGHLNPNGYGFVQLSEIHRQGAHRFAYLLLVGPVADELEIDHLCRNRSCVNPSHLEPVTHRENMRRAWLQFCQRGHELTPENTWTRKDGRRRCRLCANERNARYRAESRFRLVLTNGTPDVEVHP